MSFVFGSAAQLYILAGYPKTGRDIAGLGPPGVRFKD